MSARERLYAKTLDEVRADHRHRYEWAAKMLAGKTVLDAACGCGYGSAILSEAGCRVFGLDNSAEAIEFAEENWGVPRVHFTRADLMADPLPRADAIVSFETVEHLKRPKQFLRAALETGANRLLISSPNEDHWPHAESGNKFHARHYTPGQLAKRLRECGWLVTGWYKQVGKTSPVELGTEGRTIIAEAVPL